MSSNEKSRSNRKKKYVDRDVQGALVRRLTLHWCSFLVIGTAVTLMLQYLTDPLQGFGVHFKYFLQHQSGFLIVMVCLTPVFLLDTVKLSHRFAGPILRLRRAMKDLANGKEVEKLKFRPGDFWSDLADDFNAIQDRQRETAPDKLAPSDPKSAAAADQALQNSSSR